MKPSASKPRDSSGQFDRATRLHEESATRYEAAAVQWDARGEPEWAEFERRCAELEREAARLDENRTDELEERPGVAEERVRRKDQIGHADAAATELRAAGRAREAARRASSQAQGWLELSVDSEL